VLPTTALGLPNLPSALVQVSLGEQVARAYAPTGGVVCLPSDQPVPPPTPRPQGMKPPGLAYTTMAYQTIPMFWTGTAMLLVGVVLVAAVPTLRNPRGFAPLGGFPPPDPPADPPTDAEPETAEAPEAGLATGEAAATEKVAAPEAEADAPVAAPETETPDAEAGAAPEATTPAADAAETEAPEAAAETETAETEGPVAVVSPVARVTPSEAARRRRRLRKARSRNPRRRR
jgi:hypothetical protein